MEGTRTRIGRAAENDVVLPDPGVSRFHAEIERLPEGYVLRDLGSTNGTLVGGRRVRERLLEEGDILRCGDVEMGFELLGDAASPPPGER
jgi:pSer/pThr/pTyr-binding forkhead associated (FHA) protein